MKWERGKSTATQVDAEAQAMLLKHHRNIVVLLDIVGIRFEHFKGTSMHGHTTVHSYRPKPSLLISKLYDMVHDYAVKWICHRGMATASQQNIFTNQKISFFFLCRVKYV